MKLVFAVVLTAVLAAAVGADLTGNPKFQHPLIKDHGGIVELPDAAQQPKANAKVLLDITSAEKTGRVIKGFDRAALIFNQYTKAGADQGMKMVLILHGPATQAALSDEGFARHAKPYAKDQGSGKNPDLDLLRQLRKSGVEIYVCGQALAHHGYGLNEVAPEVTVAASAATVNINLQMEGYAYIPFH